MGLFDRSSSSTTNLVENRDNRLALETGASGISGDGNSMSVYQETTDYGAIAKALEVSGGTLAAANQSIVSALTVAGSVANNSVDLSLSASASTMRDALAMSASATRDALLSNTSISRDALSALSVSNKDSLNFASIINRDSLDLATRGQTLIANSAAESLGWAGHVVDLAFKSNDYNSKTALEASQNATAQVARAYDTATGYQADKQTADSKYLVIAGLVAVALVAMRAFK